MLVTATSVDTFTLSYIEIQNNSLTFTKQIEKDIKNQVKLLIIMTYSNELHMKL